MRKALGQVRGFADRHKFLTYFGSVVPLLILAEIYPATTVQLYALIATLPIVVLFLVAYTPERPGREWFGASLQVLAVAVLCVVVAALLVRLIGPEFRLRVPLVTTWIGLTCAALIGRTAVLMHDQWDERRGLGGWVRRKREERRTRKGT